MSSFWDYQARRAAKESRREEKVKRTEDLERTQDVWKGVEVKEHSLSATGWQRILKLFGRS